MGKILVTAMGFAHVLTVSHSGLITAANLALRTKGSQTKFVNYVVNK